MDRSIDDKMKVIRELREAAGSGASDEKKEPRRKDEHFFKRICTGFLIRFSIAGIIFITFFFIKDKNLPVTGEFNELFYLSEEETANYRLVDFAKLFRYNSDGKD